MVELNGTMIVHSKVRRLSYLNEKASNSCRARGSPFRLRLLLIPRWETPAVRLNKAIILEVFCLTLPEVSGPSWS